MCREVFIMVYGENPVRASALSKYYGVNEDCPIRSFRPHSNGFLFPCATMRGSTDPQNGPCLPPPNYLYKVGPVDNIYSRAFSIRFAFDIDDLDFGDDADTYLTFGDTTRKSLFQHLPQLEASLIGELNLPLWLLNLRLFCGKEYFFNPSSTKKMGRMENCRHVNPDNETIDQMSSQILRIDEVEDLVAVEIEEEEWVEVTVELILGIYQRCKQQ